MGSRLKLAHELRKCGQKVRDMSQQLLARSLWFFTCFAAGLAPRFSSRGRVRLTRSRSEGQAPRPKLNGLHFIGREEGL